MIKGPSAVGIKILVTRVTERLFAIEFVGFDMSTQLPTVLVTVGLLDKQKKCVYKSIYVSKKVSDLIIILDCSKSFILFEMYVSNNY